MNAHATLADGTLVFTEINATVIGVDEVWLVGQPNIYLYTSGSTVDVYRRVVPQYLGEYRIFDNNSGDWFVYAHDDLDRLVVRGQTKLLALGELLTTFVEV